MWNSIKEFFVNASVNGLHLPFVYDATTKKPSVTLMFVYVSYVLMIMSAICMHFYADLFVPSVTCILIWALTMIFYRLRKLDSVKIDFDDRSLEFNNNNEKKENEDESVE